MAKGKITKKSRTIKKNKRKTSANQKKKIITKKKAKSKKYSLPGQRKPTLQEVK
jgi:hypothetical protein